MVRFSESELISLDRAAGMAGSALAAWIGDAALRVADGAGTGGARAADLICLHADVVGFAARAGDPVAGEARLLLVRLEAAAEAVVAEIEGRRS